MSDIESEDLPVEDHVASLSKEVEKLSELVHQLNGTMKSFSNGDAFDRLISERIDELEKRQSKERKVVAYRLEDQQRRHRTNTYAVFALVFVFIAAVGLFAWSIQANAQTSRVASRDIAIAACEDRKVLEATLAEVLIAFSGLDDPDLTPEENLAQNQQLQAFAVRLESAPCPPPLN